MKLKDIVIRIGYTMLGAMLTLCIVLIYDEFGNGLDEDELTVAEASMSPLDELEMLDITMGEELVTYDYEAEAEERLAQLKSEAEAAKKEMLKAAEEAQGEDVSGNNIEEAVEETISGNSIDAAPVKWKKDSPVLSSTVLLEEKLNERSSYEETLAVNAFDKKVIEESDIDFSNVKITVVGDSLTEASNLSEEEREKYAYPVLLQEILGCKEVVNQGIGGSTVSACGDYAMVERRKKVPLDSDIVIIMGGTNDSLFINKWDFGEIEYENRCKPKTFCGDLDDLCESLSRYAREHEDNYIKFFYVNPPSSIISDGVYQIDPGNLIHQSKFAEAINTIAPEYGFDVIDMYNNNILNTHDKDVVENFMPDGIHGNPEGYRIIAEHIASQIIQRIEQ